MAKRDPADVKKIAQLVVRMARLKQELAIQTGRAIALDRVNDALLEQRNELILQMSTVHGDGTEEDRRALFEGTFASAWCACGDCPRCDAQEGRAAMIAVRRPTTFTGLLDTVEDIVTVLGNLEAEHGMAVGVKPLEEPGPPCNVQVSVKRAWVRNSQGRRMEMMVLVAGEQGGTLFMGDVALDRSVNEQLRDLFGRLEEDRGNE